MRSGELSLPRRPSTPLPETPPVVRTTLFLAQAGFAALPLCFNGFLCIPLLWHA